ncbi:MAG: CBS domain-containing protein [Candidatus Eisenbacteria bacterium]|nr:CBS domain-containing protein [Candidatus Eisenbacteria bacterium]
MTCRDLMTENPVYCTKSDIVVQPARLMRDEQVGPIPVVEDPSSRRLIGIVTDRDLALKVVAEGRDPNSTRVEAVMTRDPITCHPDDDVKEAMSAMEDHQLRRIPIVEDGDRLVGIIAQADIARKKGKGDTAEVVKSVSEPQGKKH